MIDFTPLIFKLIQNKTKNHQKNKNRKDNEDIVNTTQNIPSQEQINMEMKEIEEELLFAFKQIEIEPQKQQILIKAIYNLIIDIENTSKLSILYEYEKHYLELIQKHKEEIKFANSIQEDLRRERSQFFTYGLREVCETLKNSGVDNAIASEWIQELVKSYTRSLDVSSDLATNRVVDIIGELKKKTKEEIKNSQGKGNSTKDTFSSEA
jgi:hypothetical protein